MPIALADVTAADRCGGKAAALGAMLRAGLPVPDGFAIAGTSADPDDVRTRAAALGGTLAVRSSMSIEDDPGGGGAGAGVFASMVDVPAAEVWDAVRAVWDSATSPFAIAYARGREIGVGVIVQRFVRGPRLTIYTRPPGAPDRDEAWIGDERVLRSAGDPRVALALRAETAIGAARGADVELIATGASFVIVQARPIVHPLPRKRRAPPDALFAFTRATPGVTWRWDAAHNPHPLSPAQTGLVEHVDASGAAPYRMRVIAGYLYATASDAPAEPARDAEQLRLDVEAALVRANAWIDQAGRSLADALDAYVGFYRAWSREVGPPIAATRRAVAARVPAGDPAWHPRGTIMARLAAGELDAPHVIAPAWDVAARTVGEAPAWLADAAARSRSRPPRTAIATDDPDRALAAAVAELAEADDFAFARAQALVRRALLALGARLGLAHDDDVFWLPFDELLHDHAIDPVVARARARAARTAAERTREWEMPLEVRDGAPVAAQAHANRGFGGRATGRALIVDDLASLAPIPQGAVVVVPAVTPALAVFAQNAAAIIADHGGALDHGVALARELGIPYVIAPGATRSIAPGSALVVDGDAGTIEQA